MSIIRSFGNAFEVVDYTEEVNTVPNSWGTIGQMGIFAEESVAEQVVVFEEVQKDGNLIVDRVRGDRANQNKDYTRKLHSFPVPHFPLDDAIYPRDVQGKRAYGKDAVETVDAVRARKIERISENHSWTLEAARAQCLTLGTVYAPNGTVTQNWYDEFGKTRTVVPFALGTAGTDVLAKSEAVVAAIQDNAGTIKMTGIVALCSPEFFSGLIGHASIRQAYQYYSSTQEPFRNRAGGSVTAMHREFTHGNIRYVEMRDAYNGTKLIPSGTATFIPTGTNYFKTYFAPAERFGLVNTLGERMYMFETAAANGTAINIETESNFVNALLKPEIVITGTVA